MSEIGIPMFFPAQVPSGPGGAHAPTHAEGSSDPVTITENQVVDLITHLSGKVPTTRSVTAGSGLTGGGALSADISLAVSTIDATQHANQTDGGLHAAANGTTNGFMSATDYTKLFGISSGATNTPLSSSNPSDVGTTSPGSGTSASKNDHVHAHGNQAGGSLHNDATTSVAGFMPASDKTRLDGMATGATNTPLSSSNPSDVGTTSPGSGTSASKYDHVHAHGNQAGGSLHSDATTSVSGFIAASDKTRLDGMATGATNTPLSSSNPSDVGTTSPGSGTSASKYDHVHGHGNQAGGSLHSDATTSVSGFIAASDKTRLDGMATGATNTPLSSSNPSDIGTTSPGSGTSASKYDHVHGHGNQAGGSLHAEATQSTAGFLSSTDKLKVDTNVATTEVNEIILIPTLGRTIGARLAIATYYGASYPVPVKCSFTKVWGMLSAAAIGSVIRCTVYQKADGTAGLAALVSTGTYTVAATGAQVMSFTMSGTLIPGLCWILFGLDNVTSGSSVRVYANNSLDLLNQNVPTGKYPITFTTTISSNGSPPSTFNPVSDATATTSDVAMLNRFGS